MWWYRVDVQSKNEFRLPCSELSFFGRCCALLIVSQIGVVDMCVHALQYIIKAEQSCLLFFGDCNHDLAQMVA